MGSFSYGQDSPLVRGTVRDESGAVIPGARVDLSCPSGAVKSSTITDADGAFVFRKVSEPPCELRVGKDHFDPGAISIDRDSMLRDIEITLRIATVRQSIEVVREKSEALGYAVTEAVSATKLDTPVMQTAFSIDVVPPQVIQDQQAIRLQDVTRNVSGVQTNFGYGGLYEAFALRGFETNVTLRNGERVAGGIGRSSVDMANVQDVEVLKGPAAMIYGRLEPGGMINVITKSPLVTPHYSIQQQFGSYNLFRTTADATGPISRDGALLYRAIYSFFDADQFITHAPHGNTEFFAPSITWHPNGKLVANIDAEIRSTDPLTANGIAAIGNRPADIPISTYLGGDIGDKTHVSRKLIDFNVGYQFNSDWNIRGAGAVTFDDINFEQFFGGSLDETSGPTFGGFTNVPWFDKRTSKGGNASLDLTGHLRFAGMTHTILAGTDYYQLDFSDIGFVNGWAPVDTMNIFNPVFGRPTAFGAHNALKNTPPDWTSVGNTAWHGVYVQDQIQLLENVHLLLGGRYDWARATAGSITLEYADPGSTLNDVTKTIAREHKFSPEVGLVYQPIAWLSLFGNYVSSLGTWGTSNVIAVDSAGNPLPAERSHSYEGGVKTSAFGGRLDATVSAFKITKTNVATRDLSSVDPNALRAVGEARSAGLEVDVAGKLTNYLRLIASYAYTDAKFNRDNNGLQGNFIANVPRNSGSLWIADELFKGKLSLGGGTFLRGQRQGDNENTFQLPGYATVEFYAATRFRMQRFTLVPQLNISNLLDKRYFLNTNVYDASPRLGIMPGQPRTVIGSIKWEF